MTTIKRASKSDIAYGTIRDRIVQGTYAPGDRLILDQLARELDISPMPVREAVRRLEAEGWVVFTHNVGAQVADIDLHEYGGEMETLALLEGYATANAAAYIDEAQLARADELNERMRQAVDAFDPMTVTRLNHEFHLVLCEPCTNQHLKGELTAQWRRMDQVRRSTFSIVPSRARESVAEHVTILGLIRCGAPFQVIESFARQHKLNTLSSLTERSGADAHHADAQHPGTHCTDTP